MKKDMKEVIIQAVIIRERNIEPREARKKENFDAYHVLYRDFGNFLELIYQRDMGMNFQITKISDSSFDLLTATFKEAYKKFEYNNISKWIKRKNYNELYHIKSDDNGIYDEIEFLRKMRNLMHDIYMEENKGRISPVVLAHNQDLNKIYTLLETGVQTYRIHFQEKRHFEKVEEELTIKKEKDSVTVRSEIKKLEEKEKEVSGKEIIEINEKILSYKTHLVSLYKKEGTLDTKIKELEADIKKRNKKSIKNRLRGRINKPDFEELLAESMRQNQKLVDVDEAYTTYESEMYRRCMKRNKRVHEKVTAIEKTLITRREEAIKKIIEKTKAEIREEYI